MTTDLRQRVDAALTVFLDERRGRVETLDPAALPLVDEVRRLVHAGGKRIRPAFCYWGFRAAGGEDEEPIVRAAAALELLHTMAIVHDDLIDGAKERRGVPSTAVWFSDRAAELGAPGDPRDFGASMAILVGDVSAVWADGLLLASGFKPGELVPALVVYHDMREHMAVGQSMDVAGAAGDPEVARRAAALKGGSYTVEGPLLIGAALAGGSTDVRECLARYGRPLGEAFQLRDDLEDGEAAPGVTRDTVNGLVAEAKAVLDPALLPAESIDALGELADMVAM
ncbi:MAG TPA: polyprenyl synthetase family protein [Actinomycetota bacterium]|nr:polyprenyl synthetase family protein [Actinomycetota bacterium]